MRWRGPLAGVIALLFVLNAGALATIDDDAPKAAARRPPAGKPVDDSPLAPVITSVSAFVETSRGLKFKQPVRVRLLDGDAFNRAYLGTSGDDTTAFEVQRTLGFIHPDLPLEQVAEDAAHDVLGFYDPTAKTLYVRGSEPTAEVRATLAHELAHALQDQHFQLDRGDAFGIGDEADIGLMALAEGDALRVERAYVAAMSPDDQQAVTAEEPDPNAPPPVEDVNEWPGEVASTFLGLFPYVAGERLVDDLVAKGGQAALDEAFRNPPATTAQLYAQPEGQTTAPALTDVADPPADGEIVGRSPFGAVHLDAFILAQWEDLDWRPTSWRGGRFVAWRADGATCVRFTVAVDSAATAIYLVDVLEYAAAVHGRASVTGRQWEENPYLRSFPTEQKFGPITYTACGPPRARTHEQANDASNARQARFYDAYERKNRMGKYAPTPTTWPPYQWQQPQPIPPSASYTDPGPPPTTTTAPPENCVYAGVVGVCDS